jgi:hypothetical protein
MAAEVILQLFEILAEYLSSSIKKLLTRLTILPEIPQGLLVEVENVFVDKPECPSYVRIVYKYCLILLKLRDRLSNAMICIQKNIKYLRALFRHHE